MKKFLPVIISLSIFIIFLLIPAQYINKSNPFQLTLGDGVNLNETTFKGVSIQNVMLKDSKYYPIYGSSELEKKDPFHPYRLFDAIHLNKKPFLIGTGGSTDLIHAINIGSHVGQMKNKKVAIIISPQWFTEKGIENPNFGARFSPQQILDLLDNQKLSPELKAAFAKRVLMFDAVKNNDVLSQQARNIINRNPVNPTFVENSIDAYLYKNALSKNDDLKSRLMIPNNRFSHTHRFDLKNKSWEDIRKIAVAHGKKRATNNPYYMRNQYYNLIKAHKKKDKRPTEFYAKSPEFNDLELLVRVLKESGADPLFISIPANGKWYDHIGIKSKQRQPVYNKIHQIITAKGFKLYDITDKEYEPYVLSDAVHIGWKGWVYIDEQMVNHIKGTYKQQ